MWPNLQKTVDFVTFTDEILKGKPHFLRSDTNVSCRILTDLLISAFSFQCRVFNIKILNVEEMVNMFV